jgi:squalene-hopene/tetraprenyl-beta-curcumene cyclase
MRPMRLNRRHFLAGSAGIIGAWTLAGRTAIGADEPKPAAGDLERKAVAFLRGRQDRDSGAWSIDRKEPGITALVVTALLRSGLVTPAEPVAARGLDYLEQFVDPKGGLAGASHANYATAIGLMAFQQANKNGRYDALIKGGQDFLKTMQWDEAENRDRNSDFYGGAGYGGKNSRPDLSNTAFMVESLRETGLPADDPALKKALVFVSRCQNLKGEFNDQPWAGKVNDGGFVYTAATGGSSVAGTTPDGGLRSYASMTYAGLRSMIYAGLRRDDPRVKAAYDYIRRHYTLDENPGLGQRGLYYYYQVFAKALAMLDAPELVDESGRAHDWRADLIAALAKRQADDGSWVNKADQFMEGDPNLVTSYGLLALAYARK